MSLLWSVIGGIASLFLGSFVGALMIVGAAKLVARRSVQFGSAFFAWFAGSVLGFAAGLAVALLKLPPQAQQPAALLVAALVVPLAYIALLRTDDGRRLTYLQSVLIFATQALVILGAIGLFLLTFGPPPL